MPPHRIDRSSFWEEFAHDPVPLIDQDEEIFILAHERVEERARCRFEDEIDVDGFLCLKPVEKITRQLRAGRSRRKAG